MDNFVAHQCEAAYCIEPFAIVAGKFQPNKSIYLSQLHLSSGNIVQRNVNYCMLKELSNIVVRPREPIAQLPALMIKPHCDNFTMTFILYMHCCV